jgi:hypothetical protein
MKVEKYLYCKKDFVITHYNKSVINAFKVGNRYKYYWDVSQEDDIFLFYDEYNYRADCRGFRFYWKVSDEVFADTGDLTIECNRVYDYFYTEREYRKLKLEKINESNKGR